MKNENHASRITYHFMKPKAGFTLVELLVAAMIMLMVFAMVYTAFIQTRKVSIRNHMDTEILQNARIGLDEMTRIIRMIGYHRDNAKGQVALIEAAPFQIIFNADVYDDKSALPPKASIKLYDSTDYVTPLQNYTTYAETIRWTLDNNNDGLVDRDDTREKKDVPLTPHNPNDMVLIREINGGDNQQITIGVLGPFDANDQRTNVTPLFQYWLLETNQTFALLGDGNGDGQLDGEERYFRSITSQVILQRVRRIRITLTTESDGSDPFNSGQRRRVSLSSEVSLRNME